MVFFQPLIRLFQDVVSALGGTEIELGTDARKDRPLPYIKTREDRNLQPTYTQKLPYFTEV